MLVFQEPGHVHVEYDCEVEDILTTEQVAARGLKPSKGSNISADPQQGEQWEVFVLLTNGRVFGCDLIVSATGAYPNTSCLSSPTGEMEVSGTNTLGTHELSGISTVSAE